MEEWFWKTCSVHSQHLEAVSELSIFIHVCLTELAGQIVQRQELHRPAQSEFGWHPPLQAPAPTTKCHTVLRCLPQLHIWLQPGGQAVYLWLRLFHSGLQNQVCPLWEAIHELPLLGSSGRGPAPRGVRGVMGLELFHTRKQLIMEIYTSLTHVMSLWFFRRLWAVLFIQLHNQ